MFDKHFGELLLHLWILASETSLSESGVCLDLLYMFLPVIWILTGYRYKTIVHRSQCSLRDQSNLLSVSVVDINLIKIQRHWHFPSL